MSAFNARLKPKEIFGLPIYAVFCVTVLLPSVALAVLVPFTVLKIVFGILGVISLFGAIIFLLLGSEITFFRLRLMSRSEMNCVTSETWTES